MLSKNVLLFLLWICGKYWAYTTKSYGGLQPPSSSSSRGVLGALWALKPKNWGPLVLAPVAGFGAFRTPTKWGSFTMEIFFIYFTWGSECHDSARNKKKSTPKKLVLYFKLPLVLLVEELRFDLGWYAHETRKLLLQYSG